MDDDYDSFNREVPNIGDPPKGEGLLEKPLETEEISSLNIANIRIIRCKAINVEFHTIEGEIIQATKIPVNFLPRIQNYENVGIRNEIQKRLYKISQYGGLVQKGGIYIFYDSTVPSYKRQIYVGESNELLTRLKHHKKTKQGNFSSILIITSVEDEIGKDKLKVIESRLIRSLKKHPEFEVTNKQENTKFQVGIFDEPLVKKYYEIILDLIEWIC